MTSAFPPRHCTDPADRYRDEGKTGLETPKSGDWEKIYGTYDASEPSSSGRIVSVPPYPNLFSARAARGVWGRPCISIALNSTDTQYAGAE